MTEKNETLYKAREKRITDAIELRKPDRVPIASSFAFPITHSTTICSIAVRKVTWT